MYSISYGISHAIDHWLFLRAGAMLSRVFDLRDSQKRVTDRGDLRHFTDVATFRERFDVVADAENVLRFVSPNSEEGLFLIQGIIASYRLPPLRERREVRGNKYVCRVCIQLLGFLMSACRRTVRYSPIDEYQQIELWGAGLPQFSAVNQALESARVYMSSQVSAQDAIESDSSSFGSLRTVTARRRFFSAQGDINSIDNPAVTGVIDTYGVAARSYPTYQHAAKNSVDFLQLVNPRDGG